MKFSTTTVAGILLAGFLISGCSETTDSVTGTPLMKPDVSSETAQTVGVTFNGVGTTIELASGDIEWEFDPNCAREFFMVTGTTGSPSAGQKKAAITQIVMDNKCVFFQGGTLIGGTVTFGPKSVTVAPKNTISYPATVPVAQCWGYEGEGDAVAAGFSFQADIAGESLLIRNSGNDFWEKKFSFSLLDGDISRVTNVYYHLERWNGTGWTIVETVDVGTIDDITSGEFSHHYVANGGTFGNADVYDELVDGYTIGQILDDENGISGDNHLNNNSTKSPDSDDNAEVAHGPIHDFTVSTAGSYRVRVDANVKGNSGSAVHTFTVTGGGGTTTGAPNCN